MEILYILLVLGLLWVLLAPIFALLRAGSAERKAEAAMKQTRDLDNQLQAMERELRTLRAAPPVADATLAATREEEPELSVHLWKADERLESAAMHAAPPPLPYETSRKPLVDYGDDVVASPPIVPSKPEIEKEPFSLERFMGVKLFAWLGGLAMFFGVILFVKYAFDKNLIPPSVRVTLGFLSGIGLLAGGLFTHRLPKYKVLGQAFCATGVVILYGVTYAAHAVYHFPAFGTVPTMIVMSLITLAAFLVAVRLEALVVAVLGMLGGFLTPALVATGQDEVFGLFGYIVLLDIGLLAVSLHGRWRFLAAAAALGTALTQLKWYDEFFMLGRYFEGDMIFIPMGILLFFIGLFLLGSWWGRKREMPPHAEKSVLGLAAVAMVFAFSLLSFQQVAERYVLLYGFVLFTQLAVMAVVMMRPKLGIAQVIAVFFVFLHLAVWSKWFLTSENLLWSLALYLGFNALFLVFPFVFRKACAGQSAPWIASALSGVGHFLLVHNLVKRSFPNEVMGLIPLAFAIPSGIALWRVIRMEPCSDKNSRMAWFGGVALLFITLIFPIQFDRQWITVSWALEGAALLWLFRRVPHPGLQFTGLALLTVCFVRLALNPAVITDYPRSGTAILNWHLYAYGVVAAAQFFGAWWFTDPAGRWEKHPPRGVLYAFGGILLFLLLNIEIADYFTKPGERFITFRFGGNFPRDMTYSIAWGLFSLGLLGIGIWKKSKHARFAAIVLLVAALLKVFLHDFAMIESIFRIGALVGVAVIAFIASFLYQRFFDQTKPS